MAHAYEPAERLSKHPFDYAKIFRTLHLTVHIVSPLLTLLVSPRRTVRATIGSSFLLELFLLPQ
jgi:hypothetical protein